jgi:integrase
MASKLNKLSNLAVTRLKKDGIYSDGGNLYLQIRGDGEYKSWLFRYMRHGESHDMGLGPLHTVSAADARAKAQKCRTMLLNGITPLDAKKDEAAAARQAATKGTTFEACATAYIDAHKASWKQERHADQWNQALAKHAYPTIGKLPIQSVDTDLVLKVLQPIWEEKTETAKRLRGRIESIIDWAKVKGYRQGENPARWRGHLDNLLASPNKLINVEHFAALPYAKVGAFMKSLDKQEGKGATALKLVILTAARSNEVLGATWDEIDFKSKVWTVPAERMKAGKKEHRVPLTEPVLAILKDLKQERDDVEGTDDPCPYIFPNTKGDGFLSNTVMLALLKRMNRRDITVHGFRSTFRDWAAENTEYPDEVVEMALAHAIQNKVKAAYLRTDLFEKRRVLMEEWAEYCRAG